MLRIYAKLRRIKGSFLLLFRGSSATPIPPVQSRLSDNTNNLLTDNSGNFLGDN